uniref:Wsv166-like protein n=1 Tax=Metopaulias depressus WSSV-like virus TaxID=1675544 RepID=A0A0K0VL54_9VIRU|nr:wsv166-like protein [Metopaulias depressus WSSV-like virus]
MKEMANKWRKRHKCLLPQRKRALTNKRGHKYSKMNRFNIIPWEAMGGVIAVESEKEEISKDQRPFLQRLKILPRDRPMATYDQAVGAFINDYGLEMLFNSCSRHVDKDAGTIKDPVSLLKEVVRYVRTMTRRILPYDCSNVDMDEDMKKMPFRYNHDKEFFFNKKSVTHNDQFVFNLNICQHYPGIAAKLYGGIFSCHNKTAAEQQDEEDTLFTELISDVDLLCVFVAMVALRRHIKENESVSREKLLVLIFESLRTLKDIFGDQWKNWPFTRLSGGNKTRDERTFDALFGFDFRDGRNNNWVSVSKAFNEYSQKYELESLKSNVKNLFNIDGGDNEDNGGGGGGGNSSTKVYVGRPVYDMFQFLPSETHELLFGEKLANVLRMCYNYSVSNMPYVLASDTHPVIADDFPPIVPSGCCEHCSEPLLSTNNMTLVSRHAIPSARKLGIYLLNKKSSLLLNPHLGLGRGVAECMIHSSTNDERVNKIYSESEIKCLDKHISRLFMRNNTNTEERCGLCDEKLNFEPIFACGADEASFDYFPLHAFMDTFEAAVKNCSASLCPDCVIRTVLFTYEKVSFGGVAISDAFRCPCCGEYMINWLGRGSEVSKLCKRLLSNSYSSGEEYEMNRTKLQYELVKRIETCFSYLEMFQNDFMNTASSPFDFLPSKESKFSISDPTLRPPVRRYKLTEGNISNRYSLNCTQCITPLCCDRPDEYLDLETVDIVPPLTPYPTPEDLNDPYHVDVEDTEFDDEPNDEMMRYDDGPGTHRWPARLSCGFVSSNAPQGDKEIETCAEAIALLGRIPRKKRRGWNTESPEGKAVVALANWYKKNQPPENMQQLLTTVSSVFKIRDCLCAKAACHPFFAQHVIVDGVEFSRIRVSENPLVAAYFKLQNKNCQTGQQLMEYAGLFTRSLISECLLQMPECVYHRASSFVLTFADPRIIYGRRPDEAAKLDYVKSLNITRRSMATGDSEESSISYTAKQERTVEWAIEKGGKQLKIVTCFNCKTQTIKKGGCVIMTCGVCHKLYCWLCEKPIQNSDHTLTEHSLLYCTSAIARKAFENLYNVEIATLQLHKFELMDDNGCLEAYVMEDGFTFDVNTNRAVRTGGRYKRLQQPENSSSK